MPRYNITHVRRFRLLFSDYIKNCRAKYKLTQEDFVDQLREYDDIFAALDTVTLSRWERDITHPNIKRQTSILRYFKNRYGRYLSCMQTSDIESEKEQILQRLSQYTLKNTKELILNFPSQNIATDDLKITKLTEFQEYEQIINISLGLNQEFTSNLSKLDFKHFLHFANQESASFYICTYQEQFFGLCFSLHLKDKAFEDLLEHKLKEEDITSEHFVKDNEEGSIYLLNFFAYAPKIATVLFLKFYNEILQKQEYIHEVGGGSIIEDGKKLLQNLNLKHHKTCTVKKFQIDFYKTSLQDFLINQNTLKVFFTKRS